MNLTKKKIDQSECTFLHCTIFYMRERDSSEKGIQVVNLVLFTKQKKIIKTVGILCHKNKRQLVSCLLSKDQTVCMIRLRKTRYYEGYFFIKVTALAQRLWLHLHVYMDLMLVCVSTSTRLHKLLSQQLQQRSILPSPQWCFSSPILP